MRRNSSWSIYKRECGYPPDSHWPRLIVIAHLKTLKDKGKGRAPSNFVDGLEDDIVPGPEVNLGYDEPVALEDESDDNDSDFESFDSGDEDYSDTSLPNVRKWPNKRTSRVNTRHFDDPKVKQIVFPAAATDSIIRDFNFMSGGASTSAGSSGHNISRSTGFVAPTEIYYVDSDVVPDSEPEPDLLEPIVQVGWMLGNGKESNNGQWKPEYDPNDIQDVYLARREARKRARLEKQDMRMLEYQLGRRLTYVGLAGIFYSVIYPF